MFSEVHEEINLETTRVLKMSKYSFPFKNELRPLNLPAQSDKVEALNNKDVSRYTFKNNCRSNRIPDS